MWTVADRLRTALVGYGLLEVHPLPFVAGSDDTHVRVANPLSENEAYLRRSLLETLARRAEYNLSHRTGDVRVFEIGSAFSPGRAEMPREQLRIAALIMGRRRPPHFSEPTPPSFDEWDAKALAELAASTAYDGDRIELVPATGAGTGLLWHVRRGDRTVGQVERIALDAPVWASAAFAVEFVLDEVETAPPASHGRDEGLRLYGDAGGGRERARKYQPLPAMPPAEFDLALVVPNDKSAAEVENAIRSAAGDLLERLELFDEYRGAGVEEGHRSLAWRLTFRHPERTLRDKEVEGRRSKILSVLEHDLNVRQRSS